MRFFLPGVYRNPTYVATMSDPAKWQAVRNLFRRFDPFTIP